MQHLSFNSLSLPREAPSLAPLLSISKALDMPPSCLPSNSCRLKAFRPVGRTVIPATVGNVRSHAHGACTSTRAATSLRVECASVVSDAPQGTARDLAPPSPCSVHSGGNLTRLVRRTLARRAPGLRLNRLDRESLRVEAAVMRQLTLLPHRGRITVCLKLTLKRRREHVRDCCLCRPAGGT